MAWVVPVTTVQLFATPVAVIVIEPVELAIDMPAPAVSVAAVGVPAVLPIIN